MASLRLLKETLLQHPNFNNLREVLAQIEAISKDLNLALPNFLKKKAEVAVLDKETLVIVTANNSLATRIRQHAPAIIDNLKKSGWFVTKLKIQISTPQPIQKDQEKKKVLTSEALHHIQKLMQNQEESTLKCSLQKLLTRHRSKKRESSNMDH